MFAVQTYEASSHSIKLYERTGGEDHLPMAVYKFDLTPLRLRPCLLKSTFMT